MCWRAGVQRAQSGADPDLQINIFSGCKSAACLFRHRRCFANQSFPVQESGDYIQARIVNVSIEQTLDKHLHKLLEYTETLTDACTHTLVFHMLAFHSVSNSDNTKPPHTCLYQPHGGYCLQLVPVL
jgi:hypothetical protein